MQVFACQVCPKVFACQVCPSRYQQLVNYSSVYTTEEIIVIGWIIQKIPQNSMPHCNLRLWVYCYVVDCLQYISLIICFSELWQLQQRKLRKWQDARTVVSWSQRCSYRNIRYPCYHCGCCWSFIKLTVELEYMYANIVTVYYSFYMSNCACKQEQ